MELVPFLPTPIVITALILWVLPIIRAIESKTEIWTIKAYISLIWSLIINIVILNEIFNIGDNETKHYYPLDNPDYKSVELIMTKSSLLLVFFISIIFTGVIIYSIRYLKWESLVTDRGDYKLYYYFLLFVSFLGSMIVIFSNDAFTLFVGWEIMVLPAYGLISFRPREHASEAGLKYALQSSVGSVFLLYGIATLYELGGTFNLTQLKINIAANPDLSSNVITWQVISFLLIGFGVTAGIIGMQSWIPDAYSEAPSPVGAFISGTFALAAVVGIYKLIINLFDPNIYQYGELLLWAGIITMTLGNLGAVQQKDVRRLLGYSSIAQRGYLLFGLGIISYTDEIGLVLKAVYAQAIAYVILEGILFLAIGNILYMHYTKFRTRSIDVLRGGASGHTISAVVISVCALGLAGVPPSFGFVTKISLVIVSGMASIPLEAFILFVVNSGISVLYYARFIRHLIMSDPNEELDLDEKIPTSMNLSIILLFIISILLAIKPNIWINLL